MKKRIITIGVLMMSGLVFSQVGIGIRAPHKSALLELKADAGEYRGILIPRIPLNGLSDKSNINKGDVAESLLVFNTSSQNGLTPGFYYWRGTSWTRVIDSKDILENVDAFPRNKVMSVLGNELILEDSKGHQVRTPKIDLNIITTITEKDNGKYVYKNEAGVESTIDVTGSVITNIEEILKDVNVKQEIYNTVAAEGKVLKGDNAIEVVGGEKAVLSQTTLSLKDGGVTPKKIEGGESRTLLVTSKTGEVKWVSANDKELEDILKLKETTTVLDISQKAKGIYTYYNEEAVKNNGVGVDIDVNSLSIDTTKPGVYVFKDLSSNNPLATIDVAADVINNIDTILKNANVQNSIYNTVAAQGKAVTPADGSIKIDNGGKAALEAMQISIADKGVIPTKIAPGLNKQLLVTDKNGKVSWVDATDEVIKDAIKLNERVTVLTDNKNGTFTYYNESVVNEKGDIVGVGVNFDANTLRIVERKGPKEKGIYDFYDGLTSLESPLMTISTRAKSIHFDNNTTIIEGDNLQEVIDNIINKIEIAQNKPADLKGEGILINNATVLTGAVLKEALLTIADGAVTSVKLGENAVTTNKLNNAAVTPVKIAPGKDKTLLVTKNGKVEWVPASDEVIKDVVATNETVTVIVNNNNGTYSYYNEKGIDAKGNIIAGKGQLIDANTLSISDDTKGKYIFSDGNGEIATIDIQATVINNIDSILEHTDVQNSIYTTVAAKGKKLTGDKAIKVSGDGKEVLSATALSLNDGGVEVKKLEKGADKTFLVTTKSGEVKWIGANDSELEEILKLKETNTVLVPKGKGIYTYFNEEAVKNNTTTGVDIDVNSLSINDDKPGVYEFRDLSSDTPLAIIDIPQSVIENITTILDNTDVQNNIYNTVAAKGKAVTSPKNSIAVAGQGDKAVLNALELEIATGGVQTAHIAPNAVTPAKLEAGNKKGQLLVTNANGEAQWIDANDDIIKEVLKGNQAITLIKDEGNGTFTYYNEECFDKDGVFIEGSKGTLFDANTLYIKNDKEGQYVFFDKKDPTVPLAIIDIQKTVIENISEILNDVNVKNEIYNTVAAQGKELTSTDKSIDIKSGNKAVLEDMNLSIAIDGVKTATIQNNAVTTEKIKDTSVTVAKINPEKAVLGTVLTTTSGGTVAFKTPKDVISPAVKGHLIGEKDVIHVTNAPNVLFGDKDVTISINEGGISSKHIRNETIVNEDIAPQTIQASRLDATNETAGHVATVNADGTVSYQALSATAITNKGNITTDGVVSVDNGTGKVLANVALGINDKSVTAAKLDGGTATVGSVATVGTNGTVSYQPLTSDAVTAHAAALKTDGIILVGDAQHGTTTQAGTLFKETTLSIKEKGITTAQLADNAVTNAQIAAGAVTVDKIAAGVDDKKRVMVTDDNGVVKWGELDDIVTDAAGNLTSSDNIIDIKGTSGPVVEYGQNALFKDVVLSIKDNSITNQKIADQTIEIGKLSNIGSQPGMVMVTNANGGFTYVDRESIVQAGEDLTVADGLEFTIGNGNSAVLAQTGIRIKDQGISTAKLEDGAVTTTKISSGSAGANTVLTAKGDSTVEYKKINNAVFEGAEANLLSDGSLEIPKENKAVLKETTIGVANSGIATKHIAPEAVTVAKIGTESAVQGSVLSVDTNGKAAFTTLENLATTQGKAITSTGKSLAIAGNKAALQDVNIDVANEGIKTGHIAAKAVTVDKIGTNEPAGKLMTTNGKGGVEFKSLSDAIDQAGQNVEGDDAILVTGGNQAALKEVSITLVDGGVSEAKLAPNAVTTTKISNAAVTAEKIAPGANSTLLGTDKNGTVKWLDVKDELLNLIIESNESVTYLHDNKDGTFTYFNEKEVDKTGMPKPGAKGTTFDANTLTISNDDPGVFVFKDKLNGGRVIGTIDIRASKIIFQDGDIIYNNVEEAITNILNKIEDLEQGEIPKAAISGKGILVNGVDSQADAVLKAVELTIADNAITTSKIAEEQVTTAKIKGGVAKQLLVTNKGGKTEWVDATDEIIKDVVNKNETVTVLTDLGNGKFTYQNEADIKAGNEGVTFDANTLRIEVAGKGRYEFYDKSTTDALAVIDVKADVIENILEIVNEVSVKEEIFNVVAAQGKKVSGDDAIAISAGGDKAALSEMTISLKDSGVTSDKIKKQAVTEDKLYAGENKVNYVPVVQGDGSVKYQPMTSVVTGEMLTVDNSLAIDGDASKALLQELGLKVNEGGIVNTHIQPLAVTTDKISSTLGVVTAKENDILMADGSGNTKFSSPTTVIESAMQAGLVGDEAIAVSGGVTKVLFGDDDAKLTLVAGGVKGKHIATETIKNGNIANNTIEAGKLTAGTGVLNRVAMADDKGVVTYQSLSTNVLTGKGTIKTDEVLAVDNGVDKVLADVTLSVKNNSIKATKFDADGAAAGSVPMVSADGKAVTYQPLNASSINNKGNITTDTALTVSDDGKEKVLSNVTIGVKPQGITTEKIADNAVTNIQVADLAITAEKISSKGIQAKSVLISGSEDNVFWGELKDIVTNTAGNLELDNDNILKFDKGTGVNALLADVKLGVNDNSITKEKLSSKVGGKPAGKDKILVSNDAGGFDLVDQTAVQVGGKDLGIGSSLTFTKGDGLNTVLVETGIDVKEQGISTGKLKDEAVTVAKMSSGAATANSVLTAKGGGKVAYEPLSETAFAGKGANFLTDGSIAVLTDNQALLKETKIAIAENGVTTSHIANKQVTAAKINSEKAANGTVLMADSKGNATFQSLDEVAKAQGKAVKSTDGSIAVTDKNKAALQDLTINIATEGVKSTHIAAQQVTADKIGAPETGAGLVLTTDGQGAAKFESLGDAVAANGKALIGGTGIDVVGTGAAKALLQDATINISDGGVSAKQLAANAVETAKIMDGAVTGAKIGNRTVTGSNLKEATIGDVEIAIGAIHTKHIQGKNVTTDKISSTVGKVNSTKGQVLTADGSGGAKFETIDIPTVTKGALTGAGPVSVSDGSEAVLKNVALDIKAGSITGGHIAKETITTENIGKEAIKNGQIAANAVGRKEIYNSNIDEGHFSSKAVSTRALADQAVTDIKIGSGAAQNGEVLTANGSGGASWKKATGGPSFFYAPTFHVKVVPGAANQVLDVYQKYVDQFSGSGVIKSDGTKSLHVYAKGDLDYFVVYYDTDVFTNVSISEDGVLKYSVKTGANVTAASYFNVVFQLK